MVTPPRKESLELQKASKTQLDQIPSKPRGLTMPILLRRGENDIAVAESLSFEMQHAFIS
jgi:hypothetical protein